MSFFVPVVIKVVLLIMLPPRLLRPLVIQVFGTPRGLHRVPRRVCHCHEAILVRRRVAWRILARVRAERGMPVITDVHESTQVPFVARHVDVLQIPAFLCRQSDLLIAAGESGCVVNVKKGQFASSQTMIHAATKVFSISIQIFFLKQIVFFFLKKLISLVFFSFLFSSFFVIFFL